MIPGFVNAPMGWVVYLLYKDDVLIYVGQSKQYQERLRCHQRRFEFDRVMIKYCENEEEAIRLEEEIINLRKPEKNVVLTRRHYRRFYAADIRTLPKIDLAALGLQLRTFKRRV